ncbi:MAG: amidohydrolase [Oscillospiraceae bacterium]
MIRLYNGRVLAMAGGAELTGDEVWVSGSRIDYVGKARADAPKFERELDLRGDLLMPGFKNAHTHSAMTFLRSYADDLPLQSWLFDKVFPLEARLTPEHVYTFTKLAIMEYLTSGITSAFDMYFHLDAFAQAVRDCGFRSVLCCSLSAGNADWRSAERDFAKFNALDPLLSYKLGFHAEYTASDELLRYISELSHSLRAPVWAHNSETLSEVSDCRGRHGGKSPTEYFDSLGLFDFGGGGYHCVHLSDADLNIFAERGLCAVTCPASNAKLASGIAPLGRLAAKGVPLAVGTDGAASNNALDMFRELYLACVLQKLAEGDASACDAELILAAATSGGARAMGLSDCDCIAPGKQADLIVIDLSRPNMRPLHNIPKNLVYAGSKENVRMTMIAGKILYQNGVFNIGEDPARIYAEAERMTKEIINHGA